MYKTKRTLKFHLNKLVALILFSFLSITMSAQKLSREEVKKTIGDINDLIEVNYVVPELRNQIIDGLNERLKNKRYFNSTTPKELSKLITEDLLSLSNDHHLYLREKRSVGAIIPDSRRQMRERRMNPEAFKDLLTFEKLDGNIVALNLPMLPPLKYVKKDIDSFFKATLNASAIIIDVRNCIGGMQETLAYIAGGVLPNITHLTSYYNRDGRVDLKSIKTTYGEENKNKRVYILTSPKTFSAGEGLAFYLQQLNRATIVGLTTKGGGRSNNIFQIGNYFELSVSVSTSITPNGKQFQGIGVIPDIVTPSSNAKKQAQINALLDMKKNQFLDGKRVDEIIRNIDFDNVSNEAKNTKDRKEIKQVVLGYIESFFANDTLKVESFFAPEIAKRGVSKNPKNKMYFLEEMPLNKLKEFMSKKPVFELKKQKNTLEILDVFKNTASVKLKTGYPKKMEWIEYIHLYKIDNGWKIVNILWDYYPRKKRNR